MGYANLNSSKRHDWRTPPDVLELARLLLTAVDDDKPTGSPIPLDVATHPDNPTCADRIYAPPDDDGLLMPWDEPWWCNPPFGRALPAWAERAATAKACGILLSPARVDTAWWGRIYDTADLIVFWRGRMKFRTPLVGPVQAHEPRPDIELDPSPFPVQLAIYAGPVEEACERRAFVNLARDLFAPHSNGFAADNARQTSWNF